MNGIDALKAKFADVELKANARTMEEVVAYIEENWGAFRVKITESELMAHYKAACEFAKMMGKDVTDFQDDIRRYRLPNTNKIHVVLGMNSEYMTAENGMKYYQALCLIKGLSQEDIDTKNERWLQYVLLLDMAKDWEKKDEIFLAEQKEMLKERGVGRNRMKKFHSGFVALIGRPNVGKSTLMNCLIGEKIAITSHKPQTTRNKITSILTKDDFQCVFPDTPGIHKPKSKLGEYMVRSAETTFNEVDLVLMLIEPTTEVQTMDEYVLERIKNVKTPVVLVINKIDTVEREALLEVISVYSKAYPFAEVVPISAMKDRNTGELLEVIRKYLPEGPQYFPADMVTDQPERQIASEIIREKALYLLQDEVPHGIAVEIMSMKKRPDKDIVDVQATIYCERDSHKGIIIGKQGAMLKRIGSTARYDMQRLLGSPIYLQLWVKVKKDWRDSDFLLKNFGYDKKNI